MDNQVNEVTSKDMQRRIGLFFGIFELLFLIGCLFAYMEAHEMDNWSPMYKSVFKEHSREVRAMAILISLSFVFWLFGVYRVRNIYQTHSNCFWFKLSCLLLRYIFFCFRCRTSKIFCFYLVSLVLDCYSAVWCYHWGG